MFLDVGPTCVLDECFLFDQTFCLKILLQTKMLERLLRVLGCHATNVFFFWATILKRLAGSLKRVSNNYSMSLRWIQGGK